MTIITPELIALVRDDYAQSERRWEAAIESDGAAKWADDADECEDAYETAIKALEAGDLAAAETALESANLCESRGGDNCDAHHARTAVRAAM